MDKFIFLKKVYVSKLGTLGQVEFELNDYIGLLDSVFAEVTKTDAHESCIIENYDQAYQVLKGQIMGVLLPKGKVTPSELREYLGI